ncbi:MAG: tyrosine-type recombinase/integrase [Nitrosopumilaceae archaeon]
MTLKTLKASKSVKEKSFENYLEKNQNLSESTLWSRKHSVKLFNEFVDLDAKIKQFKNADEPDEEMEELMQEWINHIVKNPPNVIPLSPQTLKQYVNSLNAYLKYHRFRTDLRNLKFPKELKEEKHAISVPEIKQILRVAEWKKKGFYLSLISTGARPREILGLTKNDVTWLGDKYKAIIPAKLTKKGMSRSVFFSKECTPFLNKLLKKEGNHIFPHHSTSLKRAVSNEDNVFRSYCNKIGFTEKYDTTGYFKINLYCFRSFFFTKALDHFKDDIAHAMIGHGAYLQVYQRRNEAEKKVFWDELEPDVLIFDESKKDQKIKELEISQEHTKKLEVQIQELLKFKEDSENEIGKLKWINQIKSAYLESGNLPEIKNENGQIWKIYKSKA